MMKSFQVVSFAVSCVGFTLFGCKAEPGPGASASSATSSTPASSASSQAAASVAFTGPLTAERITASKNQTKPFEDWESGKAKLERFLGKPTKVEGKRVTWAVVAGDACTYTYIEKEDRSKYIAGQSGDMVGAYRDPYTSERKNPEEDCFDAAGSPAFPEDPGAVPPPADGKPTSAAIVLENATKARSKWEGKKLVIEGLLDRVDLFDGSGPMLHVIGKAGASDPYLMCEIPKAKKAPPDPGGKAPPIRVEATVHLRKLISSKGVILSVELRDCDVATQK